jgi:hypothetical protein
VRCAPAYLTRSRVSSCVIWQHVSSDALTAAAIAARLNVAPEILAAAAVGDLLDPREDEFEAAAALVLRKNRELYRRLA